MDRKILILLLLFIIIFEYQFIYSPNKRKIKNLEALIEKKEKEYREFLELCEKYKNLKKDEMVSFKIVDKNFSFFTYLNNLIDKFNLKGNVGEIKILPSEELSGYNLEKIQFNLNLINLEQLLSILEMIEKTKGVYITRFEISRDKNKPYLLNLSMIITCLKKKEDLK
ncbi:MAG: hypothetical protein NC926_05360 [Candidatus Omnitrophica bacterium]|nr:hypothetical protein [Candidatus Omnitrophota bacterium]MCM8807364.1 hypothetical protein [Candidatus Omnitrophota bacterium]